MRELTFGKECISVRVVEVIRGVERDKVVISVFDISDAEQCMGELMRHRLSLVTFMTLWMINLVPRIEPKRAEPDVKFLARPHSHPQYTRFTAIEVVAKDLDTTLVHVPTFRSHGEKAVVELLANLLSVVLEELHDPRVIASVGNRVLPCGIGAI